MNVAARLVAEAFRTRYLVPSTILRFGHKAWMPTVFLVLNALRERFTWVPLVLVGGLAILLIHLALYPWPDITRESTTYAGLTGSNAQNKAEKKVNSLRVGKPKLSPSTEIRAVDKAQKAWLVYFVTASKSDSGCVVATTDKTAEPSPECSK